MAAVADIEKIEAMVDAVTAAKFTKEQRDVISSYRLIGYKNIAHAIEGWDADEIKTGKKLNS